MADNKQDMTRPTPALAKAVAAALFVEQRSPEQQELLHAYFDVICGDCDTGRCHGGAPCGCYRHEVSVRWRKAADRPTRSLHILALTIWQPWAGMIADGYKPIENRRWPTYHTGLLAIHAATNSGTRDDQEYAIGLAARLACLPPAVVARSLEVRGAVVAVARLTGVCSKSLRMARGRPLECDCGPWALSGERHFKLADVRALPEPVPCKGAQKLWQLPDEVYEAVFPTARKVLHG